MKKYSGKELAVVGISGRFNSLESSDALWNALIHKEDVMNVQEPAENGFLPYTGTVNGKTKFDPLFFGYTASEASRMDPQVRLLHEEVWKALEDAGEASLNSTKKIGLFASVSDNLNWRLLQQYKSHMEGEAGLINATIADGNFAATLISYKLNLKGPIINTNTACSSSLVNVHLAARSLLMRECNVAVAAAMCATSNKTDGHIYEEGGVLSKDGYCRAFDKDASGTVPGEGGGVVVLKRLEDAIKDKDRIYALIKGSAINNDGQDKVGYVAPSVNGQVECINSALNFSQVDPDTVSYIETHGTGTSIGDSVEFESLRKTYGVSQTKFTLGALKTTIGHLDTAAGIAGFIKTTLALHHKVLPPTLHFNDAHPELKMHETKFELTCEAKPWKQDDGPRRAGVSSFGIGGTNSHVILEEFVPDPRNISTREEELFVYSAKSQSALKSYEEKVQEQAQNFDENKFLDFAFTLATKKQVFSNKSFSVRSRKNGEVLFSNHGKTVLNDPDGLTFMFPGQGLQYVNMARDLYDSSTFFKKQIDAGLEILNKHTDVNYRDILFSSSGNDSINQTEFTQPLLFVLEYSLAKWLIDLGLTPNYLMGHSLGEFVAVTLAGVFSFEDALQLVTERAKLMCSMQPGTMMVVNCTTESLESLDGPPIDIAAVNADDLIVISGTDDSIDEWKSILRESGIVAVKMETSHAFHSSMMNDAVSSFAKRLKSIQFNDPLIPIISSLTGELADSDEITSIDYWLRHMRNPVQLSKSIETLINLNQSVFIEVGPGAFLSSMVKKKAKTMERAIETIHVIKDKKDKNSERSVYLKAIGNIWKNGFAVNLENLFEGTEAHKCSTPVYTFDQHEFLSEFNLDQFFNDSSGLINLSNHFPEFDTPKMKLSREVLTSSFIEPVTTTEIQIAEYWSELFEIDKIGKQDNFFDLGGDSIKALRFSNSVRAKVGIELNTQLIYENPTVESLAKALDILDELYSQTASDIQGENELTI